MVTVSNGPRLARLGAWMGIAFTVLFVAGFAVASNVPNGDQTAKWARWWNDSGHRASVVIGTYLMVLGLLAFVWFAASVRERVGEGGGLMFAFGSIFVAVALAGSLVRAAIPGSKIFGNVPVPAGADLARQLDGVGFALILVAGALAAGVFVALASLLARRRGVLPGWLTVAGFVVAVLQLAAGLFFPFVLLVLWVLATSIVLIRRPAMVT